MTIYAEPLPADCPPASAQDECLERVYRLVASDPPNEADFASKAALGKPCPPDTCMCGWSSCSLSIKAKTLRNYVRLRKEYPYLAELKIPSGKGKKVQGDSKRGHVDFWVYAGESLTTCVVNTEGPENDV